MHSGMRWGPEVRAASILMGLALTGAAVRGCRPATEAPGAVWSTSPAARPGRDTVAAASARLAQPLGAGERIAVNRASAAELDRLPGIGPALAGAIVADREANGPYRTPADLDRVRGIGPALVARLRDRILLP
jgi:competence protein ComEA